MKVSEAFIGARGVDSLPFSQSGTQDQAHALKRAGVDFVVGYLGSINPARLAYVLDAGLAFMPVTFAGEYFDGARDEISHLKALRIPPGVTVWLDLEGRKSYDWPASDLISLIDTWANTIKLEGYIPGLYVGSPQPLTGPELAKLAVTRYWKAPSLVLDRNGKDWSEPPGCGWCMQQMWPQGFFRGTGVFVDVNIIGQDRKGRVPTWMIQ